MSRRRRYMNSPELKAAVASEGLDAVNSDEDMNGLLDEQQQEAFLKQMTGLVRDYVRRWQRLLTWVGLFVLSIHAMAFIGIFPVTTSLARAWVPRSIIFQVLTAPVHLCTGYDRHGWIASVLGLVTATGDWWILRECTKRAHPRVLLIRLVAAIICVAWIMLSWISLRTNIWWGKHTVVYVATPLLAIAGELFMSSRSFATAGLEKLVQFKYSYKKP